MEKQTLTLHRALSELKMLDKKISRKTLKLVTVGSRKGTEDKVGTQTLEEFNASARSDFQSVQDLIERKNAIKSAIVVANSTTEVKIGEVVMTISDAITMKSTISLKEVLVNKLKKEFIGQATVVERHNASVDANALTLVKTAMGSESETNSEAAMAISKPYTDANSLSLVDPLGINDIAKKLEDEVEVFKMEVDAVLSEANATTVIEF